MTAIKSGQQAGAENADRIRAYLEDLAATGQHLPQRDGKSNMPDTALAAGVDRQLYKNPAANAAAEQAAASLSPEAYDQRPEP